MNECSITQDELDKLLSSSANNPSKENSKNNSYRTSILEKLEKKESELNKQLKDLKISLTQDEVDKLLKE